MMTMEEEQDLGLTLMLKNKGKRYFFYFFTRGVLYSVQCIFSLESFPDLGPFFAKLVKNYFRVKTTKGGVTYQMIGGILKDIWP